MAFGVSVVEAHAHPNAAACPPQHTGLHLSGRVSSRAFTGRGTELAWRSLYVPTLDTVLMLTAASKADIAAPVTGNAGPGTVTVS